MFFFRKPLASIVPNDQLPFISILVPARNEEQNIEACIRSLMNQNYPSFEIIALDDNSEDATYDILCRLRDQDYRLRVLVGAQLPDGWFGKPFACWQMARASAGEFLLLTDADCIFDPDALLFAVGARLNTRSDVISMMPDYVAETVWEKLTIPLLVVIPMAFLPFGLVRTTNWPAFAAANGAFLYLSRDDYFAIDGHRAVKTELTEDVKFSQHIKRRGKTLSYLDGKSVYSVRMYSSFNEIWEGFTRILMPAFDNVWLCLFGVFIVVNLFILPPALAVYAYFAQLSWAWLSAATYLTMVSVRLIVAIGCDRDYFFLAPLNPLNWLLAVAIAFGSIFRNLTGRVKWKGRHYGTPPR
jgi:chlorobactene glucosyltransferase